MYHDSHHFTATYMRTMAPELGRQIVRSVGPCRQPGRAGAPTPVWPGSAYPLGATYDGAGTNFSLFSEVAEKVDCA